MAGRRKRRGRQVNGILLLDKPVGLSSNQALQRVKRLYDANKAGHTGSLDVPASGLLPVCLGEATKISAYLLDADKTYLAKGRFGIITTTGDAAGDVLQEKPVADISEKQLQEVLASFIGETEQVPPMFSALKHQGKRLYELAYQGIEVERKARQIKIHDLSLNEFSSSEFSIKVNCSKGTYIRTLVQDIGFAVGCGAHVTELRRIHTGPFNEQQMFTLEALETIAEKGLQALDEILLPMDQALKHLPSVCLDNDTTGFLLQGQVVVAPAQTAIGRLRVYNEAGQFLGLGEHLGDGKVQPKRLINLV